MIDKNEFVSVITCESNDITPVFFFDTTLGMEIAGLGTSSVYVPFDGEKSGRSIMALQRYLEHDAVIGAVTIFDQRTFGGRLIFPDNGTPIIIENAFRTPDRLYDHDPQETDNETLSEIIRSFKYIRKQNKDLAVGCPASSPFSIAALLRGYEALLMDMLLEPDYFDDLMEFTASIQMIHAEKIMSVFDPDFAIISCAYDSIDTVGGEVFEGQIMSSLKPFFRKISAEDIPLVFHPHGTYTDSQNLGTLDKIIGSGIDCIYYGEGIDSSVLAKHCHNKVSVMGGIDTFTTIYLGPDDRVRADVKKCLNTFSDEHYVISCSCCVDRGLNMHRMKVLVDTVRNHQKNII